MDSDLVLVETRGTTLRIAMNRPSKKNALTLEMYDLMTAALARASSDDAIRAVIVTGAPNVFTAGNDLGDFMKAPPTSHDTPVLRFLNAIVAFEKPLIAAVDGPAVGVGTTMLLHCDYVIATEQARFHMPFTKLGLVPEAASSFLVPALVGRARAAAWILLARPFDAKEALAAGLVNQLVPAVGLNEAAEAVANEVAALPREAVRITKRLLNEGTRAAIDDTMKREVTEFIARLSAPETLAAFSAFMTRK